MKLEDLTEGKVKRLSNEELMNLQDRANQVFGKILRLEKASPDKRLIFQKYLLVVQEMERRGMKTKRSGPLSRERFLESVVGVCPFQLEEVVLKEAIAAVPERRSKDDKFSVVVRTNNKTVQDIVAQSLEKATGNKPALDAQSNAEHEYPLYDLVLRPREMLEKVKSPTETPKEKAEKSKENLSITDLFTVPIERKKKKQRDFTKLDEEQGIVGAVVYRASTGDDPWLDADEEWTDRENLERAAYDYMCKSQQILRMHDPTQGRMPAYVIESFITDAPTKKRINDETVYEIPPNSWWLAVKIDRTSEEGEELWKQIKSGQLTGFSFGGRGFVREAEPE